MGACKSARGWNPASARGAPYRRKDEAARAATVAAPAAAAAPAGPARVPGEDSCFGGTISMEGHSSPSHGVVRLQVFLGSA